MHNARPLPSAAFDDALDLIGRQLTLDGVAAHHPVQDAHVHAQRPLPRRGGRFSMRAVALINKRLDQGKLIEGKHMLINVIEAEDVIREFPGSSRLNNDWDFLCHLHDVGRARADRWLADNFTHIGLPVVARISFTTL